MSSKDELAEWILYPARSGGTGDFNERYEELFSRRLALNGYKPIPGYDRTESPIERILLPWLLFQYYSDSATITVEQQIPMGPYRVDFLVTAALPFHSPKRIIVECDGRDFHDAERDAVRDKFFDDRGIATVRGTGTEIYKEPWVVADKVASLVAGWAWSAP